MRLRTLYEQPKPFDQIDPGAREEFPELTNYEGLVKLGQKIHKYEQNLTIYNEKDVPAEAREALATLKSQVQDSIDKLYAKKVELETENMVGEIPKGLFDFFETVTKECSQILDYYKTTNQFLYRGTKSKAEAFKGKPFEKRVSKDSDQYLSDLLNQSLEQAGVIARRDNSIFTSSKTSQAKNYGNTYIIFPVNGFSFSYSKKIKDFVFDYGRVRNYFLSKHDQFNELKDKLKNLPHSTKEKFFHHNYSLLAYSSVDYLFSFKRDFDAIKSLIENGELDKKFSDFASLEKIINPQSVIENLQIDHKNLRGAITSGHEVVVNGNYYALSTRHESYFRIYLERHFEESDEAKEHQARYKSKGDTVTINDGQHQGITALVADNFEGDPDDAIQVIDIETGQRIEVLAKQISKTRIKTANDIQPSIDENDIVMVIAPMSSKFGQKGKVVYVWTTDSADVKFDDGTENEISKHNLYKIKDQSKKKIDPFTLKEGDYVKILSGDYSSNIGQVVLKTSTSEVMAKVLITGKDQLVNLYDVEFQKLDKNDASVIKAKLLNMKPEKNRQTTKPDQNQNQNNNDDFDLDIDFEPLD